MHVIIPATLLVSLSFLAVPSQASEPRVFTYTFRTCPRAEWRPIIEKNILSEPATSAAAIQEALFKEYGRKFLVRCKVNSGSSFVKLAPEGDAYCAIVKERIRCRVEQPNA